MAKLACKAGLQKVFGRGEVCRHVAVRQAIAPCALSGLIGKLAENCEILRFQFNTVHRNPGNARFPDVNDTLPV